jgi:hypothetical protein
MPRVQYLFSSSIQYKNIRNTEIIVPAEYDCHLPRYQYILPNDLIVLDNDESVDERNSIIPDSDKLTLNSTAYTNRHYFTCSIPTGPADCVSTGVLDTMNRRRLYTLRVSTEHE